MKWLRTVSKLKQIAGGRKEKKCLADLPVRVLACFNREPFFTPASAGKDPQKIAKSIKIIWSKVKHNCKASTRDKR